MKNYIPNNSKSESIKILINEALDILESVGIPVNDTTERSRERIAVCFLAVAGVTNSWQSAKSASENRHLKTREIIKFVNENYEENISSGSYDDIRRKDLKLLVLADLIINSGENPNAATNDPTRGNALNPTFKDLIIFYKSKEWKNKLKEFNKNKESLAEILLRKRNFEKIPVQLPNSNLIELSLGQHNVLQKEIIEQFLPRFGSNCKVLYIGDTTNKKLHLDADTLRSIQFFELSHDELPDIVAYSKKNNWLYLIEAVHSSGPMSEIRVLELKKILTNCTAELIFITAFLSRTDFKKWMLDIAWETEVWIADNPDHLIHFNGHKFLGAY